MILVAPEAAHTAPAVHAMSDIESTRPAFLDKDPVELRFGTSGLRGLVADMSDLEVYINVQGFLRFLEADGSLAKGERVALARDLRDRCPKTGIVSSPRISGAVTQAVRDLGYDPVDLGQVPTPVLAYYTMQRKLPGIMVTGSHIPADRNGVKFYKKTGEVLKSDEAGIFEGVRSVRSATYAQTTETTAFDGQGQLKKVADPAATDPAGTQDYMARYVAPLKGSRPLQGMKIVFYQHSSVARDILTDMLEQLGATMIAEHRVDVFVPVDTEDVMPEHEVKYRKLIEKHQADVLISTDGDGDRPLIVDETGRFHRGDAVGIITALHLKAEYAAVPISAYDAIDIALDKADITLKRTRIGSPFVISAMAEAAAKGQTGVVGWEANGGFLTGSMLQFEGASLSPLPTRDAALPIICVLLAARAAGSTISELFGTLPARATRAGLLDEFAQSKSRALLADLRPKDTEVAQAEWQGEAIALTMNDDSQGQAPDPQTYAAIAEIFETYFPPSEGFNKVTRINFIDGVRVWFENGEVVHLRPSGNAPQFRIYTVAATQTRADEIVDRAIAEPQGTLRRMEAALAGGA